MSETVTRSEFARIIGRDRAWVTRLAQAGRLKLAPDGRVLVEESKALIEQTRGSRDDVQRRHQEERQEPARQREYAAAPDPNDSMEKARRIKAVSEARRSAASAEIEELERDRLRGSVIDIQEVEAAFKSVGAQIRSLMETFPDQVAPLVAPVATLEDCHALLTEQCRNVLVNFNAACLRQAEALQKGGA